MKLLVHKTTRSRLALFLEFMEWATNAHSCQEWVNAIQTDQAYQAEIAKEGITNVAFDGSQQHGGVLVILDFQTPDRLKDWVMTRMIQVLSEEEYTNLCRECGVQPQTPDVTIRFG
jgi:hypothetical protein